MPVESPRQNVAAKLIAHMPSDLVRRLAPGSADTVGILVCRILALPSVELFILLRVGPSIVTTVSFGFFFAGLAALLLGQATWAGLGLGLGALFDFADGMVARRTQRTSRIGFQYDYTMDRAKSAGLFLVVAFLNSSNPVRWAALAALVLLIARECVAWLIPIRRVPGMGGQSAWQVVFGRWHWLADETLRNDPWQLVLLGAGLIISPAGLWLPLGYYFLTLLVDSLVFFRTFANFGKLYDPQYPHFLYWEAEGRVKIAVARAFGKLRWHRPTDK